MCRDEYRLDPSEVPDIYHYPDILVEDVNEVIAKYEEMLVQILTISVRIQLLRCQMPDDILLYLLLSDYYDKV